MPYFKITATMTGVMTYIVEAADEEEANKRWEGEHPAVRQSGDFEPEECAMEEFEDCVPLSEGEAVREALFRSRLQDLANRAKGEG